MRAEAPIFILGARRSGTTLFRLMLASHPNIAIPPEGGFVVRLQWYFGGGLRSPQEVDDFVSALFAEETIVDWELDRLALQDRLLGALPLTYAHAVEYVYAEHIDRKHPGKARWGDKTTWYLDHLEAIDALFPSARYIHIVRDGRDVAASFKGVEHLTDDVACAAAEWVRSVRRIRDFGAGRTQRYMEIRYERLVQEPQACLREVCAFVDEPFSADMLAYAEKNAREKLEPERHLGWKQLTLEPPQRSRVGRWRGTLSPEEIARVVVVAGGLLVELGYGAPEVHESLGDWARTSGVARFFSARQEMRRLLRPLKHQLRRVWSDVAERRE